MAKMHMQTPQLLSIGTKRRDEWPLSLSSDDFERLEWQPVAIREFILKINSRCNIKCDYCYLYELSDDSWKSQPVFMSEEVARQAASRIAQHAEIHQLESVRIYLHGGEPLQMKPHRLRKILSVLSAASRSDFEVRISVQTNGILLSDEVIDLLAEFEVGIGISLDGDAMGNDRHRRDRRGDGTYQRVVESVTRLREGPHSQLFSGFLATVDVRNDPVACYEALIAHHPPVVDFLQPHHNWDNAPPLLEPTRHVYGDWLIAVFDRWFGAARVETRVRKFEQMMKVMLGVASASESVGLSPAASVVIQTNGSYELLDTLKSAYKGAALTGLNIFDNDLDRVLHHPMVVAGQLGANGLCSTCRECSMMRICGGGHLPHRYKSGSGFLNPSVYCGDLAALILHIQSRLLESCKEAGIDFTSHTLQGRLRNPRVGALQP
jgi:uncharacterized protein